MLIPHLMQCNRFYTAQEERILGDLESDLSLHIRRKEQLEDISYDFPLSAISAEIAAEDEVIEEIKKEIEELSIRKEW